MARLAAENGIDRSALVLVGDFLDGGGERSRLYDPVFETAFRRGRESL